MKHPLTKGFSNLFATSKQSPEIRVPLICRLLRHRCHVLDQRADDVNDPLKNTLHGNVPLKKTLHGNVPLKKTLHGKHRAM